MPLTPPPSKTRSTCLPRLLFVPPPCSIIPHLPSPGPVGRGSSRGRPGDPSPGRPHLSPHLRGCAGRHIPLAYQVPQGLPVYLYVPLEAVVLAPALLHVGVVVRRDPEQAEGVAAGYGGPRVDVAVLVRLEHRVEPLRGEDQWSLGPDPGEYLVGAAGPNVLLELPLPDHHFRPGPHARADHLGLPPRELVYELRP